MDHDRLFKELLTTFFIEFLELFYFALQVLTSRFRVVQLNQANGRTFGPLRSIPIADPARWAGLGKRLCLWPGGIGCLRQQYTHANDRDRTVW